MTNTYHECKTEPASGSYFCDPYALRPNAGRVRLKPGIYLLSEVVTVPSGTILDCMQSSTITLKGEGRIVLENGSGLVGCHVTNGRMVRADDGGMEIYPAP